MKTIPDTTNTPVLRTDFSNQKTWEFLKRKIEEPIGEFQAYVDYIDDIIFKDFTIEKIFNDLPEKYNHALMIIADKESILSDEHTLLILDVKNVKGRTFRVILPELWAIENNLSIGNMSFSEFANYVDERGIFRGFPDE